MSLAIIHDDTDSGGGVAGGELPLLDKAADPALLPMFR